MAKTLSAIVAGASLAPALVGADYMVQSGSYAAGRIAQNLLNRKNVPQEIPLTDTELIELAGLVENLQDKIINAYYNYKGALSQLKEVRSRELLYSKNYAKAMDEEDFLEISISSALYQDMQIEEVKYLQMAKKYHHELQRLAGKKIVDGLNLYQYNYDSALIGGSNNVKNKLLLIALLFGLSQGCVFSETLSELEYPKPPAYRVGISEIPENQYVQAKQVKPKIEKTYAQIDDSRESSIMDVTYADLSIKRLSKEIAQELEFDEQDMLSDLSLLWQGAAMKSDTINFALYKLANPDADKPDSKSVKNVLKTIASMSTLVGASMGSPIIAGSSLIGGNILGIMSQDTKELNYKYTRVTDADMIILIRKIEDLQQILLIFIMIT